MSDTGRIYFITTLHAMESDKYDAPIKIGFSKNPRARLAELQTGNPQKLEIIVDVAGGRELEDGIHRELGAFRLWGEWFEPCWEVLKLIEMYQLHVGGAA
jgi:hypothetical protein